MNTLENLTSLIAISNHLTSLITNRHIVDKDDYKKYTKIASDLNKKFLELVKETDFEAVLNDAKPTLKKKAPSKVNGKKKVAVPIKKISANEATENVELKQSDV